MRILAFLLLATFALAAKKLTLGASKAMDYAMLLDRIHYVEGLAPAYPVENTGNGYTTSLVHPAPPANVYSLEVQFYGLDAANKVVDPPSFEMSTASGMVTLKASFAPAELNPAHGCQLLEDDPRYYVYYCTFYASYISTENAEELMKITYNFRVKILRSTGSAVAIDASPILKNGCNCTIEETIFSNLKVYTDSACTVPLSGGTVKVGTDLCLKFTTNSALANQFYFNTKHLIMTYTGKNGVASSVSLLGFASKKCGANTCGVGVAQSAFEIPVTGKDIIFSQIVQLEKTAPTRLRRLEETNLEGKGVKVEYKPGLTIEENPGLTDSASGLAAIVAALVTLVLLVL